MDSKKICCVCQQTFVPDPRVKKRQKTCTAESYRKELKKRTDKAWRTQNPDYFKGRYDVMLKEWYKKMHIIKIVIDRHIQNMYKKIWSTLKYIAATKLTIPHSHYSIYL